MYKYFVKFRQEVLPKAHLYEEIDKLLKNLSKQGVLEAMLSGKNVEELNRSMGKLIPNYMSPLNSETAKEYFRNVFITLVLEEV